MKDSALNAYLHHPYYIRVTNVELFNLIVAEAEKHEVKEAIQAARCHGYYELRTTHEALWHELAIYGQMLAQLQSEFIETGEERSAD